MRLPPPRRIVAALLVALARLLVRLPGPVLVGALDLARRLFTAVGLPPDGQRALTDLARTLRDDARGRAGLREILHRSRPGELSAILEGLWIHHRGAGPARGAAPLRRPARSGHPARVVVVGLGPRADAVARAYAATPGCRVVRVATGELEKIAAAREPVSVVEIAGDEVVGPAAIERLVVPGRLLRTHAPSIPAAADWERLAARARAAGGRLALGAPLLSYPPARVAWQRIADGELGAVGSIRVQAVLGTAGGSEDHTEASLRTAALEQAALLAWLGGSIAEVRGYAQSGGRERGGQAVLAIRFAAPGRYGGLEIASAPRWPASPASFPARWEVEVSGTHGILWLRAGAGYAGPPVEVRVGRRHTVVGVGAGMATAWEAAWGVAASDALASGARPGRYALDRDPAALRSALEASAQAAAILGACCA